MDNNLAILVEAKKEYTDKLCELLAPLMIDVFDKMFQEATTLSNNRKVLQMFQKLLKEVPNWSNAMSKQHTDNVINKCSWFGDLLAAVFVSHVKILSSVRLRAGNKKLSLKLPTNEVFVQTCYNNAARDLYNDPYIFAEVQSEYVRDKELFKRFSDSIEMTVKELIPVQHILQTYMNQNEEGGEGGRDEYNVEESEPIDDEDVAADAEPIPPTPTDPTVAAAGEEYAPPGHEIEPQPDHHMAVAASGENPVSDSPSPSPVQESSVPFDTEVGVKTISTSPSEEREENLFEDAPEQRTKKLSYM
ncbi:hypothetical protein [Dishui Lake phycodnavirus 4]|nr:hypothetical protein [Dishui Lake phycodnavirus 4]